MKKFLLSICLLVLFSCSEEPISNGPFVTKDGVFFYQETMKPVDGIVKIRHPGEQFSLTHYKNGIKHGTDQSFKEKTEPGTLKKYNQLWKNINYVKGKKNGIYEMFYSDNGQLYIRDSYTNDLQNGLYERFSRIGIIREQKSFKDGKLDGYWIQFLDDGSLQIKTKYKDGKKDGLQETFHTNGKISHRKNYINGLLEGFHESFTYTGELSRKNHYKNDELHGLQVWYDQPKGDFSNGTGYVEDVTWCYKNGQEVDMSYCD
ncbi:hypothetical protein N9403_01525 [Gammaproteobacteria bacterium]|nr:hypothetical protein [Gammaproteobacteria bacterium]